jgi:hypothetical protein
MLTRPLRILVAVVCLATALALVGCGAGPDANPEEGKPAVAFRQTAYRTASAGDALANIDAPTPAQAALLAEIVVGLGADSAITAVAVGPPGQDYRESAALQVMGTTWLTIRVRSDSFVCPARCSARWEASLLAGAYRDLASARGLPGLLGYSAVFEFADGRTQKESGVIGAPTSHVVDPGGPDSIAADVREQLETASARVGPLEAEIAFEKPLRYAPRLVVRAADPDKAVAYFSGTAIFGNVEGSYLEVQDAAGKPLMVLTGSTRVRQAGRWGPG